VNMRVMTSLQLAWRSDCVDCRGLFYLNSCCKILFENEELLCMFGQVNSVVW